MLLDIHYVILDYLFMSLSHLALVYLLLYVLILWICIFRFRDLERSGAIHWGPRVFQWAGRPALVPPVPYFSFWLTGSPLLREHLVYIFVYILLDLVVRTIHLYSVIVIITCITLYLYFCSLAYEYITLCVVLWFCIVLLCLAYIRGGCSDLRIYVAVTSPYPWNRGVTGRVIKSSPYLVNGLCP